MSFIKELNVLLESTNQDLKYQHELINAYSGEKKMRLYAIYNGISISLLMYSSPTKISSYIG